MNHGAVYTGSNKGKSIMEEKVEMLEIKLDMANKKIEHLEKLHDKIVKVIEILCVN